MLNATKCGHCGKTGTKLVQIEPREAAYKQSAICCSSCNAILGVTGFYDAGTLIKQQEKKIDELRGSMNRLQVEMEALRRTLAQR